MLNSVDISALSSTNNSTGPISKHVSGSLDRISVRPVRPLYNFFGSQGHVLSALQRHATSIIFFRDLFNDAVIL